MTEVIRCPNCGLIFPDSAERCDCGYRFPKLTVEASGVSSGHVVSKRTYKRRTKKDNLYLALAVAVPLLLGRLIGGPLEGSVIVNCLACFLLIYEIRMSRLTPKLNPVGLKEIVYVSILVVFLWLIWHFVSPAASGLFLALVSAVRNYRMRRQWDRLETRPANLPEVK